MYADHFYTSIVTRKWGFCSLWLTHVSKYPSSSWWTSVEKASMRMAAAVGNAAPPVLTYFLLLILSNWQFLLCDCFLLLFDCAEEINIENYHKQHIIDDERTTTRHWYFIFNAILVVHFFTCIFYFIWCLKLIKHAKRCCMLKTIFIHLLWLLVKYA